MRQLLLDLLPESPPSLDNFVPGGNGETLTALTEWLAGQPEVTAFCLHGEAGCGKSHLLQASGFCYIDAQSNPGLTAVTAKHPLAIDNVDALDATGQIALFALFNQLNANSSRLLTAAQQPPQHLAMREDLRTRLGSGLIYRLRPLTDDEKAEAVTALARERALKLSPDIVGYLLRHVSRDMRTLAMLVVALDQYTLEQKRPVTLPLLRELLSAPLV
ncbi:DnaA regulatory inactivator Hda [Dechloromonas agitata]|uniref:DnaA regulatory inactivator Hda n=1 Tax=Dechloromonas agitata TaxID=73030 RepID=A0A930BRZ5_9RHOO|nr:DnaA regulatory inactivator Hda [Dechloromonas agitata]MBF1164166.1 DnaA regulatory inactivator Hda [Dechloromonas agitata]MDE1545529.1 DnaA regulatory inactivator Hda [Dechloromonas agitata]